MSVQMLWQENAARAEQKITVKHLHVINNIV